MNLTIPAHQRQTDYLCGLARAHGMIIPDAPDAAPVKKQKSYHRLGGHALKPNHALQAKLSLILADRLYKVGNPAVLLADVMGNMADNTTTLNRHANETANTIKGQANTLKGQANTIKGQANTLKAHDEAFKALNDQNQQLKARVTALENPKNETVNFADKKNAEDQIQNDLSVSKSLFGQIGRIKNTGLKVLAYIGYVLLSILTLGILPAVNFSTKPFQTLTGKKSGKVIDEKVEVRKQFDRKDAMLADLKKGVTLKKTNNEQENIRRNFERIAVAKNAPLSKEAAKKVALVLVPSANPNAKIDVRQKLTKREKLEKIAQSSDTRQALIAKRRLEKMNKEEAKPAAPAAPAAPAPAKPAAPVQAPAA